MATIMPREAAKKWWGIDVPKNIIYFYHNDGYCFPGVKPNWKTFTIQDLIKDKVEKQNRHIADKRRHTRVVPCYICVHKVSENGRWYILIQTVKFNIYPESRLNDQIRQRYNCGVFPELTDLWAETFYRRYKVKPTNDMPKRAIKYTKCVLNSYGRVIEVL